MQYFVSCFFFFLCNVPTLTFVKVYLYLFRLRYEEKLLVPFSSCLRSREKCELHIMYICYVARLLNNFYHPDKMHRRIVVTYVMESHLCNKNEYKTIFKTIEKTVYDASTCAAFHLCCNHFYLFRLNRYRLKTEYKSKTCNLVFLPLYGAR